MPGSGSLPPAHGRRGAAPMESSEAVNDGAPAYDYLLAVGPGRSGTTFLYRRLTAHPAFCAPEIKEARYYRSVRRLERALRQSRRRGAVLVDVADMAWSDPRLARVAALARRGLRILVVVSLRRHGDRARSMIGYRLSRVLPALPARLAGPGGLERAVVRDSLAAPALRRVFALGADVLTVEFESLARDPERVLDALARVCRVGPFDPVDAALINRAQRARSTPVAAAAKLAALALRGIGARRLLQSLKDSPRVVGLVFRPAHPSERPALGAAAAARLACRHTECRAVVEAASESLGAGLWLARGAAPDAPPPLPET